MCVGAGLAGAKAAEALRADGFDGRLVLLGAEPHGPYERPPLSKGYLQGSAERETIYVHPSGWYAEHQVELRLDTVVTAVDRREHELVTGDGSRLRYDKLLLTTGATPRRLTVPGSDLNGVHYLRSLDDSERLKSSLNAGTRVVVIGAGWIGLETAASARTAGAEVTVLERGELPLLRVLGPQVARVFADLHTDHGVDLRCGVTVAGIRPVATDPSTAGTVLLADGAELDADVIIVGIGVTPNVELARSCGLNVDNGILVDRDLRTSDVDILAAGDVANAYHPLLCRQLRVEHWANALHQPAVAAATMLGETATYDRLPYFFTDQYDLGMEYTGYTDPDDNDQVVIRGDSPWCRRSRRTARSTGPSGRAAGGHRHLHRRPGEGDPRDPRGPRPQSRVHASPLRHRRRPDRLPRPGHPPGPDRDHPDLVRPRTDRDEPRRAAQAHRAARNPTGGPSRQAAQAERLTHQRRGGPRQPGTRRGVFPQKISNDERVLLTVLYLRRLGTLDVLADTLGDISRSALGGVVRETRPLLEQDARPPPPAPVRYCTAAELLAATAPRSSTRTDTPTD